LVGERCDGAAGFVPTGPARATAAIESLIGAHEMRRIVRAANVL
jgi:hypothetical protein